MELKINMKTETERYSRQYNLIPQEILNSCKVITIGCGIGGSWATYLLAKMGVKDIEVYDFDIVEDANIPSQLYGFKDIGKPKVEALRDRIKNDTDTDIIIHNEKVTNETEFDLTGNTIILLAVDTIEARKEIFSKLKGSMAYMVDGRIGGEIGYQIYGVNLSNDEECSKFEKTLEGTFVNDMPCGTKAIIYSSMDLVSQIVNIVKRVLVKERHPIYINKSVVNFDQLVKWEN
jgi:hypothetical protein